MAYDFSVSGQHYLFNVQTFAHTVLALGGDSYNYAFRDRTTQGVIDDVASGESELGVVFETSATAAELDAAFDAAGLEFVRWLNRHRAWRCRQATRWSTRPA